MSGERDELRGEKRPYEPPVLTREGDLRRITAGGTNPGPDGIELGTLAS